MSHDTDKLIRQLSLVAFLMAELRPLTARDVSDRGQLHAELRRMAVTLAEHLVRTNRVARTVTTKLRYPDFSIRTRSSTFAVGSADATEIGNLACTLLDRGLRDRPGALRLVGLSVSNLEPHQQLALA